jgi:hypothetical protein
MASYYVLTDAWMCVISLCVCVCVCFFLRLFGNMEMLMSCEG